jgi:hypothetical protein
MTDIGKPVREIEVQPLEDPVPREQPVPEQEPAPVTVPERKPELVPA